jgi:hypothetical protein
VDLARFGRFGVSEVVFVIRLSSPHMKIVRLFHLAALLIVLMVGGVIETFID